MATYILLIILLIIILYYLGQKNPSTEELAYWITERRSNGGFFSEILSNFERVMVEDMIDRKDYVFFSLFEMRPDRNTRVFIIGIGGLFFPVKKDKK